MTIKKEKDYLDGVRIKFSTVSPAFIEKIARVLTIAEKDHGVENWKLIEDKSIFVDHLQYNLNESLKGHKFEEEKGRNHLAAVAAFAMILDEWDSFAKQRAAVRRKKTDKKRTKKAAKTVEVNAPIINTNEVTTDE